MLFQEMYALTLHGEDIEALQATEKQKRIITALMKYENPEEHLKEIKDECGFMGTRLLRVHQRHSNGIEFCGGKQHNDGDRFGNIEKLFMRKCSMREIAGMLEIPYWGVLREMRNHGYRFKNNEWVKLY